MPSIAFIDTEVDPSSKKILDIGGVSKNGRSPVLPEIIFKSNSK